MLIYKIRLNDFKVNLSPKNKPANKLNNINLTTY